MMWALLLLAGFFALCFLMWWDVGRQCERAQREVELDALWDEEDVWA